MKKRDAIYIALIIILAAASFIRRPLRRVVKEVRCDTLILRDTIRDTVPRVRLSHTVRTDTVWLRAAADTVYMEAEVPIEQKIYETEDYRAVVEGFRVRLTGMDVYRSTLHIDRTETITLTRPRRWGLGLQAGYGYGSEGFYPYVGVGIQYNIITW